MFSKLFKHFQKFSKIFKSLQTTKKLCKHLPRHARQKKNAFKPKTNTKTYKFVSNLCHQHKIFEILLLWWVTWTPKLQILTGNMCLAIQKSENCILLRRLYRHQAMIGLGRMDFGPLGPPWAPPRAPNLFKKDQNFQCS